MADDCSSCCYCSPESYWTVVDIAFLRQFQSVLSQLQAKDKDAVAEGWVTIVANKIDEAIENGERSK